MITTKDKEQIRLKGITETQLEEQFQCFKNGFPFLKLKAAASTDKGILVPTEEQKEIYKTAWKNYVELGHDIIKFVPASGAASRMFKDLFAFARGNNSKPSSEFEKTFFNNIEKFAFYTELNEACKKLYQKNIQQLIDENEYRAIALALLNDGGLGYGKLPKGLLLFHKYEEETRTPAEEQMTEGALYAKKNDDTVKIHFTVSKEHRKLFEELVNKKSKSIAKAQNINLQINFSEQKSSTDTVAVTPENKPFRTDDGSLLFRPGGHGALIENLNDLDADIVFVKNIDNVVPDRLKHSTTEWKQILAGVLVSLQKQVFTYLEQLESGKYTMDKLLEMLQFLQKKLCCKNPETKFLEDTELAIYLTKKFNRPMRVCGMVKNVGEPGGGPFLAYNPDGTFSPQILESSQINMDDCECKTMFEQGTHFNPVDLVCATKNYKGEKFNLPNFVDKATGFISHKSKDGKELKALELPGLWNGAMSNWNTVFVEVPLDTFNPVKTVNDLLREQHQ